LFSSWSTVNLPPAISSVKNGFSSLDMILSWYSCLLRQITKYKGELFSSPPDNWENGSSAIRERALVWPVLAGKRLTGDTAMCGGMYPDLPSVLRQALNR